MAHHAIGQTAQFERFAANMLYVIAAGQKIDTNRVEPFGKQIDDIYKNPFVKHEKEMTAEEIKKQVVAQLTGGVI